MRHDTAADVAAQTRSAAFAGMVATVVVLAVLVASFCSGCTANRAPGGRDIGDQLWVAAYEDAWEAAGRGRPSCPVIHDLRVAEVARSRDYCCLPSQGCTADHQPEACGRVSQDLIPFRNYLEVVMQEGHPTDDARLAGHEVLHQLRACWALEDVDQGTHRFERTHYGETTEHTISRPDDANHVDCEVWERCSGTASIEHAAWERMGVEP